MGPGGADSAHRGAAASWNLRALFDADTRRALQASGGDDYELCFALAPAHAEASQRIAGSSGVAVTRIGRVVDGTGVRAFAGAVEWTPAVAGYVHFG